MRLSFFVKGNPVTLRRHTRFKGRLGSRLDTQPLLCRVGKPGKHFWARAKSRGYSTAGILQRGESGRLPGVERSGRSLHNPLPPREPASPQGSVRLYRAASTAGVRVAPNRCQESLASLQGRGVEKRVGAVPSLGWRQPPVLSRTVRGAGGRTGTAAPGDAGERRLATSIAAGNSGLALSGRAPGLPAAAPPPPARAFGGDAAGRVLRNLRRNPEPPPTPPRTRNAAGACSPPPRRPGGPASGACMAEL